MATLNEVLAQIEELKTIKSDLKEAIAAQGGEVADDTPFTQYPYIINNLDNGYSCGIDINSFIGDIDENGILQKPNKMELNFGLIKEITEGSILANCLCYCHNITKVTFPDLENISGHGALKEAFMNCSSIKEVSFPKLREVNAYSVFNYTFNNCKALEKIYFPELERISGSLAFYQMCRYCTALTTIDFNKLKIIDGNFGFVFSDTGLVTASLPALQEITSNGTCEYLFYYCKNLESVYFPSLVVVDNIKAFYKMFSDTNNVQEIHFKTGTQPIIEVLDGYSEKWGATNATIYFDL